MKVHTFNQDRESVAQELEIEEAAPAVIGTVARALTSPGLKGTLSRAALNKTVSSMTSEDQPEPLLNDLVKQDAGEKFVVTYKGIQKANDEDSALDILQDNGYDIERNPDGTFLVSYQGVQKADNIYDVLDILRDEGYEVQIEDDEEFSEDQPEPSLNDLVKQDAESRDDEEDIDQLPAFLKKPKSQEKELNRMRKLAGMSIASTNTNEYDGPDETIDGSFSDRQIKQAFGILNDPRFKQGNYDGAVEVINKISPGLADHPSVQNALKRANEATNDLVKTITPIKGVVGTNASPQMTAKGIDAIAQGERPSPQQVKAVSPYMSKIAQAMQDPKTKTQMRNIIKKVQ